MSASRTGIFQNRGTFVLILAIAVGFGIEMATKSVGNNDALLKLGALPDNGQLRGEFWRVATYSFLHFNWLHLLLNVGLLFWIGRIVEQQIGTGRGALIYFVSVLCSAAVILLVHNWHPKEGATVGASGGVFGLLASALIISYRQNGDVRLRRRLWIVLAAHTAIALGTGAFPRTACISGLVDSMLIDGVVPDSGTLCPP